MEFFKAMSWSSFDKWIAINGEEWYTPSELIETVIGQELSLSGESGLITIFGPLGPSQKKVVL